MNDSLKNSLSGPGVVPVRGTSKWLQDIVPRDPMLAYTLLQTPGCVAYNGLCDVGTPEIINVVGRFESGAAGSSVPATLQGLLDADLWVYAITYTVRRPNAFAGNIFKGLSDFFNAKNPNIDFELIINSFCRYLIAAEPTPLENLPMIFDCDCPNMFVLKCASSIKGRFILNRALAADEIPTEAIISLIAMRLPTGIYGSCTNLVALAALREWMAMKQYPEPPC
jgi:hypothetical protein